MNSIATINIQGRQVAVKGIGKLFYQEGFPITMAISLLKEKGVDTSLLHVCDELLKHGWIPKTVISRLKNDAMEGIEGEINTMDWNNIEKFCYSSYEDQRDMISKSLFKDNMPLKKEFIASYLTL